MVLPEGVIIVSHKTFIQEKIFKALIFRMDEKLETGDNPQSDGFRKWDPVMMI